MIPESRSIFQMQMVDVPPQRWIQWDAKLEAAYSIVNLAIADLKSGSSKLQHQASFAYARSFVID